MYGLGQEIYNNLLRVMWTPSRQRILLMPRTGPEVLFCYTLFSRLTFHRGHFPRLAECAHFHYENVDFGSVQVSAAILTHRQEKSHFSTGYF